MGLKELVFGSKRKSRKNPLDRGGPGYNDEKGEKRGEQHGTELETSAGERNKKNPPDRFLGHDPRDDSVMEELAEDFGLEDFYEKED